MLPGQPARQQLSVISNEFVELVQVLVTGQPLSQLMQGGIAPAGALPAAGPGLGGLVRES